MSFVVQINQNGSHLKQTKEAFGLPRQDYEPIYQSASSSLTLSCFCLFSYFCAFGFGNILLLLLFVSKMEVRTKKA